MATGKMRPWLHQELKKIETAKWKGFRGIGGDLSGYEVKVWLFMGTVNVQKQARTIKVTGVVCSGWTGDLLYECDAETVEKKKAPKVIEDMKQELLAAMLAISTKVRDSVIQLQKLHAKPVRHHS